MTKTDFISTAQSYTGTHAGLVTYDFGIQRSIRIVCMLTKGIRPSLVRKNLQLYGESKMYGTRRQRAAW